MRNPCNKDWIITFHHFLLAVSHHVDVLDTDELEFNVGVVVFVFVAFSCSSVCDCIQLKNTFDIFGIARIFQKGNLSKVELKLDPPSRYTFEKAC